MEEEREVEVRFYHFRFLLFCSVLLVRSSCHSSFPSLVLYARFQRTQIKAQFSTYTRRLSQITIAHSEQTRKFEPANNESQLKTRRKSLYAHSASSSLVPSLPSIADLPYNPECMISAPHLEHLLPVGPRRHSQTPLTPPGTSCPRHILRSAMEA